MPTQPPSAALIGDRRAHWQPGEVAGCPFGRLVCAVCPLDAPPSALALLLPSELVYARSLASSQRQREWVGGRLCLATALGAVSVERYPLLVSLSGAPVVPAGWSGSVSHKGPLIVALAAATAGAVGVDVEHVEREDDRLQQKVLTAAERERLSPDDETRRRMIVMHFSIKEAVYKSLDPTAQTDLEFEDIETELVDPPVCVWSPVDVAIGARASRVKASILFDGHWLIAAAMREPR